MRYKVPLARLAELVDLYTAFSVPVPLARLADWPQPTLFSGYSSVLFSENCDNSIRLPSNQRQWRTPKLALLFLP
ncbi:hypothetical protein RRG08_065106 [Elysia crispata]|uniref:Uncharacterized protein n=1 Tax=Elysia crispata TaxID=231223 RepID=A0AAE0Z9S0_9GAST|nr:hypothetical protein RRG08_065106 [Elysia crispata]